MYQPTENSEQAFTLISRVRNHRVRESAQALLAGVLQFYTQFPSLLCAPLDLRYTAVVLIEHVYHMSQWLAGTMPRWDGEPGPEPEIEPCTIDWTRPDVSRENATLRILQAYNLASNRDGGLQLALRTLVSFLDSSQSRSKSPVHPDHPVDLLFVVMAIDFALRSGQPARKLLDDWPDEHPSNFKPRLRYDELV